MRLLIRHVLLYYEFRQDSTSVIFLAACLAHSVKNWLTIPCLCQRDNCETEVASVALFHVSTQVQASLKRDDNSRIRHLFAALENIFYGMYLALGPV